MPQKVWSCCKISVCTVALLVWHTRDPEKPSFCCCFPPWILLPSPHLLGHLTWVSDQLAARLDSLQKLLLLWELFKTVNIGNHLINRLQQNFQISYKCQKEPSCDVLPFCHRGGKMQQFVLTLNIMSVFSWSLDTYKLYNTVNPQSSWHLSFTLWWFCLSRVLTAPEFQLAFLHFLVNQ